VVLQIHLAEDGWYRHAESSPQRCRRRQGIVSMAIAIVVTAG
jgi:hypothetical protein